MSTHRNQRARRHLPLVTMIGVFLAICAVLGAYFWGHSGSPDVARAAAAPSHPLPSPTVTKTIVSSIDVTNTDPVTKARQTLPLQDLKAGDRVLYEGKLPAGPIPSSTDHRRELCKWLEWKTAVSTSLIACQDGTFQVPTAQLTPIEPVPVG